jgi:hypothetical protein
LAVAIYFQEFGGVDYAGVRMGKNLNSKISTSGWLVAILLLFLCFPVCWIPIVSMRERYMVCRQCGAEG